MKSQKPTSLIEWLQIGANLFSLIVAVVALIISFNTEKRSAERFREQLSQSNEFAKANIRPLLSLGSSGFTGIKFVGLQNDGLGTAVITKINFIKNEKSVLNLADLFEFKTKVIWDNFYVFSNSNYFLRAGENVTLINLTIDSLKQQEYKDSETAQIMKDFDIQLNSIVIQIEYEDLLGNKQETIDVTF